MRDLNAEKRPCLAIDSSSTKRKLQPKFKPNETQLWKPIKRGEFATPLSVIGWFIWLCWVWVHVANYVWCWNCLLSSIFPQNLGGENADKQALSLQLVGGKIPVWKGIRIRNMYTHCHNMRTEMWKNRCELWTKTRLSCEYVNTQEWELWRCCRRKCKMNVKNCTHIVHTVRLATGVGC